MNWDLVYIICSLAVFPLMLVAMVVAALVQSRFRRYRQVESASGMTAKELVEKISAQENLNLRVEEVAGELSDHYDPRGKVVRLSATVINSTSVAALAIAAHECGHAIQDAKHYLPLKIRQVAIKVSNFASRLLTPLIILSIIASIFLVTTTNAAVMQWLLIAFCGAYGLSAFISLITLPTEFDASRRGAQMLDELGLTKEAQEKRAVRKVLSAAAGTYVVSFVLSMVYFLRFVAVLMMNSRRRR